MKILVTGAGGFLGSAITRALVARGDTVRSFSRGHYPFLQELGVERHRGDLADPRAVSRAVEGVDAVMHVAALPGAWGPFSRYWNTNVLGTRNILRACKQHNIPTLVYTSSPSVIFDGSDMENVDESVPYPDTYHAHYPRTKARAEQDVLDANSDTLRTVSLRPHLIWGPNDPNLVARVVSRAKAGRLVRIRTPQTTRVDTTYIDDAAQAHLDALDALHNQENPACAGKAYFISSGEPIETWDMIGKILNAANLPPLRRSVTLPTALTIASILEAVFTLLRISSEPPLTRWVVHELASSHWFDISAAQRDFGYTPKVSIDEGMERLRAWFQNT